MPLASRSHSPGNGPEWSHGHPGQATSTIDPLPTIQKLMRHAKVETTMIYIETRAQEMCIAINLMG